MAFQLVRGLFSRGSPPRSRIHGPTMENDTFGDQRGETVHGTRDVEKSAKVSNWSELARAPQKEVIGRYSHIGASNVGPESSTLPLPSNGHPNTPETSSSSEDETRQDRMLRNRSKSKKSVLDEIPSSTTPPNWDDYPEPAPPKPATPVPHTDASTCSTSARIAAQHAEERTSHARWQQNGAVMEVESTDFPIHNVELMPSNSIQTAYAPIPMTTQHPEDTGLLTLRQSNVDGNFYSHEFDHEEVVEAMDEETSQTSSVDEPWKRVFEAPPRRVYPEAPNGSLRECSLPSVRVQELAEPPQLPNGSLRERSLPSVCVQEIAEPPQRPNSLEFWQAQSMDELRQLAAELNRRLELGITGPTARRSGPTNGFYLTQPTEQDIPFVVRPDLYPVAHRSGPTDEHFFQRLVDKGTPSVVRPATKQGQHPDVRFQTPPGNAHGQAYGPHPGHAHGPYPDEDPAICLTVPETPEIYYPARADGERDVLLSRPRPTPSHPQEHSRQEVRRYRAADQPPLGHVELALLEPIYWLVQVTPESVTEQPSNSSFGFVSHPETDA